LGCFAAVAGFIPDGPWIISLGLTALGAALYSATRYAVLPAIAQDSRLPLNTITGWIELGSLSAIAGGIIIGLQVTGVAENGLPHVIAVVLVLSATAVVMALPCSFPSDVSRPESPFRAVGGFFSDCKRVFADREARWTLLAQAIFQGIVVAASGATFTALLTFVRLNAPADANSSTSRHSCPTPASSSRILPQATPNERTRLARRSFRRLLRFRRRRFRFVNHQLHRSVNGNAVTFVRLLVTGQGSTIGLVCSSSTSNASASGAIFAAPHSIASGRSVFFRNTSRGTPSDGASSCTPPESETISQDRASKPMNAGAPVRQHERRSLLARQPPTSVVQRRRQAHLLQRQRWPWTRLHSAEVAP